MSTFHISRSLSSRQQHHARCFSKKKYSTYLQFSWAKSSRIKLQRSISRTVFEILITWLARIQFFGRPKKVFSSRRFSQSGPAPRHATTLYFSGARQQQHQQLSKQCAPRHHSQLSWVDWQKIAERSWDHNGKSSSLKKTPKKNRVNYGFYSTFGRLMRCVV